MVALWILAVGIHLDTMAATSLHLIYVIPGFIWAQCVVNPTARLGVGRPVDDMADYRVLDGQWPLILIKSNLVYTA